MKEDIRLINNVMNMRQIIFVFLGCVMLLCQCRLKTGVRIVVYNNFERPICDWSSHLYPDTLLPYEMRFPLIPISKSSSIDLCDMACDENTAFSWLSLPADTLSFFFFDADIIERYDWQIIRDNYMILVRYDFSQKDLQKLKWRIYYPPTEEMKDMKMYPPYGSE